MPAASASRWRQFARGSLEGAVVAAAYWFIHWLYSELGSDLGARPAGVVAASVVAAALIGGLARCLIGRAAGAVVGAALGALVAQGIVGPPPRSFVSPGKFVGKPAKISGPTVDDKQFDVEQYRGKVVVIDFWATWCVPCLRQMPDLLRLYHQYNAEGLEFVGISHDRSEDALTKYVKENSIPWPQVIFSPDPNTGRRPNPNADSYDVDSIPHAIVVGRDGTIVAEGVHGAALRQAVEQALRGPEEAPEDRGRLALLVLFVVLGGVAGAALEWSFRQPAERPASV